MNTNTARAPSASNNNIHISTEYRWMGAIALSVALLAGCSGPRTARPGPQVEGAVPGPTVGSVDRAASRWVKARWEDLPAWNDDPPEPALTAFRQSCPRLKGAWASVCASLPAAGTPDSALRLWMVQHLQPWRVEDPQGQSEGLMTGYYEPLFEARRQADEQYRFPVHQPPADLNTRRPYWTRQQLDTVREAQAALKDKAIAYLRDPLEVLIVQIQGSGRLRIVERDGSARTVRLAFAAHNDHAYGSVGRWLIEQGQLSPGQASWPGIREWLQRHPHRLQEALWTNARVVFFKEEALPNPQLGPKGAMGVPLTPERSVAVDPKSVPYGVLLWLSSSEPGSGAALGRWVVAQDTGSAITGAVRADYFWGWGERAERLAGTTRQRMRWWALWPRGESPPV